MYRFKWGRVCPRFHLMDHLRARHKDKLTNKHLVSKKVSKVFVTTGLQTKIDKHVVSHSICRRHNCLFCDVNITAILCNEPSFIKIMLAN